MNFALSGRHKLTQTQNMGEGVQGVNKQGDSLPPPTDRLGAVKLGLPPTVYVI